uniref:Uncharacterized protein n=1 Tax=Anguilla anguilla TaxID=7936 RepID=A0A0E9SKQ5_ANGAN
MTLLPSRPTFLSPQYNNVPKTLPPFSLFLVSFLKKDPVRSSAWACSSPSVVVRVLLSVIVPYVDRMLQPPNGAFCKQSCSRLLPVWH